MLETKNVFIDTQAFVKAGLHFDSPAFKSFRMYCEKDDLIHVSTSVVKREIKAKIELSVKDAISAIQTFRRKARLLSSLDEAKIRGLFEEIPDEDIYNNAEDVFNKFLSSCKTKIVQANDVDAEGLLSLYFDKNPPFGEGKKKAEFPDAISMLSLESFLDEDEKIYVVSEDHDLKEYCAGNARFISVESLDKLLDIYTAYTNLRHDKIKQYFIDNDVLIKQKIGDFLESCEVYNNSGWEDAEVDGGLTVKNLGGIEPQVLFIDDEESQISFDIDVDFEVTVTGPDFNNGFYDREEGRVYTFDSVSNTVVLSKMYTVEIFLRYEFIDGELVDVDIDEILIPETFNGIEVSVEEDEQGWF